MECQDIHCLSDMPLVRLFAAAKKQDGMLVFHVYESGVAAFKRALDILVSLDGNESALVQYTGIWREIEEPPINGNINYLDDLNERMPVKDQLYREPTNTTDILTALNRPPNAVIVHTLYGNQDGALPETARGIRTYAVNGSLYILSSQVSSFPFIEKTVGRGTTYAVLEGEELSEFVRYISIHGDHVYLVVHMLDPGDRATAALLRRDVLDQINVLIEF